MSHLMKEGILSVEIEPKASYLDFTGSIKEPLKSTSEDGIVSHSQLLRGRVRLKLEKSIKIKSMSVKFKGESLVNHTSQVPNNQYHSYQQQQQYHPQQDVSAPILPKLKTKVLQKSSILEEGEHSIPWEIEIPNIYPRSFSNKRGVVRYKVELKMAVGYNRTITASKPILICRHLLPSKDMVMNVSTKRYENTIPNGFNFEIETPKTICLEQGYMPVLLKFNCINNKPVKFIYTQFIQAEIYRCRNVSKAEADMAIMASKKNSTIVGKQLYKSYKNGDIGLSKFFRRVQPVTLNTIDLTDEFTSMPLLLKHNLDTTLTNTIESPLVVVLHQLEITFNFGQEQDEIRAKVPVAVTSIPDASGSSNSSIYSTGSTSTVQKYTMEAQLHKGPLSIEIVDTSAKRTEHHRTTLDESTISSLKDNLLLNSSDSEKSIKKSASDQNLRRVRTASVKSMEVAVKKASNRRSITPPPNSLRIAINKAASINGEAKPRSHLEIVTKKSNKSLDERYTVQTPKSATATTFSSSVSLSDKALQPFNTFVGLPPPPRRARNKKESTASETSGRVGLTRTLTNSSSSSTSSRANSISSSGFLQTTDSLTSPDTSSFSPLSPGNNNTNSKSKQLLNSSKSTNTSNSFSSTTSYYQSIKKRANSIDTNQFPTSPTQSFSSSLLDHDGLSSGPYFAVDLPPIPSPPAITRQRLPSIPLNSLNLSEKDEHRLTKMYFEDESDEDGEIDNYDFMFD
ncbi:uncharacterized protein B0P05DRAFT_561995 [Gilbertella persicaria]|uniref:uncharacterized protein n=1 Tax=Gilbertella persicaria TaxID=101096 RepID=UPI00221EACE5|nr:uncharacterized protein B0P05DRAFT_561995 [Gilbertella persicaria]KAI8052573.1 hypothetical protein B0P05DRAFT_561995 [Gilbertella persicaria]